VGVGAGGRDGSAIFWVLKSRDGGICGEIYTSRFRQGYHDQWCDRAGNFIRLTAGEGD
jgi:hypothetical protein